MATSHSSAGVDVLVSQVLALSAAASLALSSMFISELKGRVALFRLARWQLTAAFAMTAVMSLATGGWRHVEVWQVGLLAASSIAGIAVASTTYFATIYAVGPRVTALLFALTSPLALALGYGFLGETIAPRQGVGVALVLAGIVLAIGLPGTRRGNREPSAAPSAAPSRWGIVLGVITAFGQALGSLLARPAMASGVEPFTAMAIRAGLAALIFGAAAVFPFARSTPGFRVRDLGIGIASAFFGTGLGMSLLLAALRSGEVGIVSTLSSMTPVLILPMVWMRTGTRPAATAWAGAALAIGGTALISLR